MRQLGWRKAWSGGLVFHTVDNRPAEGDRTNGEGCGLISYATLEFLGVIKTRDRVVEKKKKKVDAPYKRDAVLVLLLLLLPRKIHENSQGNVIGEKIN